jgi:hypothetical protein
MSWDIFVMRLPDGIECVADIPDDYVPAPIGPRAEIVAAVLDVAPFADFTEPTWGRIDTPDFSVEINLSAEDPVRSFALHIRGGDTVVELLTDLLLRLPAQALDPQAGNGIFSAENATRSLQQWRTYRDSVLGGAHNA